MKIKIFGIAMLMLATAAHADLFQWTSESESDPFSGGEKVTVNFMSSIRSGVFIFCDTSEPGIEIRSIPGFDYVTELDNFIPQASFAIDGELLFSAIGRTGQVGNNLAAASIKLDRSRAEKFITAFKSAKKQVAIKDGISDQPHLLAATGSTASGSALQSCINKQSS